MALIALGATAALIAVVIVVSKLHGDVSACPANYAYDGERHDCALNYMPGSG